MKDKGHENFARNKENWNNNQNSRNGGGRNGNNRGGQNRRTPKGGYFICGGNHYVVKCQQRVDKKDSPLQHHIHATVDHRQVEYQATPIQMTGTLFGHPVSILIDTSATECFVDPKIVAKIPVRVGFMAEP